MEKRWIVRQVPGIEHAAQLAAELNISPVLGQLLLLRGITSTEEAFRFFRPELSHLHDPFLMKDMDKAVARIESAIHRHEKILIYGDYDVDGTTSVALVYSFLKKFYDPLLYYIPDRHKEGYGISTQGINWAAEHNCSLIIALDCGIKSIDKVSYAKGLGIDFIICDHHLPGAELPGAVAVLDPKRNDCPYPYKELSGCGIGFKLVQAMAAGRNIPPSEIYVLLDLVAISIASDIVHLTGENRTLASFGLKLINARPRPGIKAILDLCGFQRQLTISDVVFVIGPRINAAGRIEDARLAVELLITSDREDALRIAEAINKTNDERKEFDRNITEEALRLISADPLAPARKTTVVFSPQWHKGVIGIVASRLLDKYYRPTIVLTQSQGKITGSARSVKDFDIHLALESCSDLLEQFGGHKYAAGLTLHPSNMDSFRERFENVVSASIQEHMLIPHVEIDTELLFSQINDSFIQMLNMFAPFGPGNMKPVFRSGNIRNVGQPRLLKEAHLKLWLSQQGAAVSNIDGIAFNMGEKLPRVQQGIFEICYTVEENEWNNRKTVQLNIRDIR